MLIFFIDQATEKQVLIYAKLNVIVFFLARNTAFMELVAFSINGRSLMICNLSMIATMKELVASPSTADP